MAAEFIPAQEVTSPRRQWSLISVLDDPKQAGTCVLALGRWENEAVLAMRWNGTAENPVGNPQSRGLPTWFIVPERFNASLIQTLAPAMQTLAWNFLPGPDSLWLEDIKAAMAEFPADGWQIVPTLIKGRSGEKLVSLIFIDPLRRGGDGQFSVNLPEDASHEQVRKAIRTAVGNYLRSHPVSRGSRTI